MCLRKMDYGTCDVVNCVGQDNKFISFLPNSAYYAFCGVPIVMFKCDDEENYKFDQNVNDCVYDCKWRGYFVDPYDCSQFYICETTGAEAILQECPLGYKFDGVRCVESYWCPSIITTTPDVPTTDTDIPTTDGPSSTESTETTEETDPTEPTESTTTEEEVTEPT